MDDFSSDNSINVIQSFQNTSNNINLLINDSNKGGNYSRNYGLKESKGSYVLFLDADDVLLPNCLENRFNAIEKNPNRNMWIFTMGVFNKTVGDDKRLWLPNTLTPLNDFLRHTLPWQTMQAVWKREFILLLDGFDENFLRLQDVELHTRALLNPEANYLLFPGVPDCYLRIDEARLNFDVFTFLLRWTNSVIQYCTKFYEEAKARRLNHLLIVTVYKTYLQILFYYKTKKIDKAQYEELSKKLFDYLMNYRMSLVKRFLFFLAKPINLSPLRLPGYNWFTNKILSIN